MCLATLVTILITTALLQEKKKEQEPKPQTCAALWMRFRETEKGIDVLSVVKDSPMEKAGIRAGDRIAKIQGFRTTDKPSATYDSPSKQEFVDAVLRFRRVALTIKRGDETLEVKTSLGDLDASPKVGDRAPDFTLKQIDGKADVTLSKLVGKKHVLILLGSFT